MHTVLNGIVNLCLRWCVALVIAVSRRDKGKYGSSIAILDKRIKSIFPVGQSITPFGAYRFSKGISVLFNQSTNRDVTDLQKVVGQGGRLEAQRLLTLLWQVCIR